MNSKKKRKDIKMSPEMRIHKLGKIEAQVDEIIITLPDVQAIDWLSILMDRLAGKMEARKDNIVMENYISGGEI